MLYPTKAPCWIHWLLRAVCAHPGHLCSETAIFFIYLLIIYPACPAKGKKSDDSTCTSHRFFFLLSEDASRAERSRVSEILRLLQKALPPDMFSFARTKEYQKGRRCPQGMKAPVGLLSRRPVCKANAACSARQGLRYFRGAGGGGLRLPASASCLGRHSHSAGRCPNSSSLFRPLAAVVAVAN